MGNEGKITVLSKALSIRIKREANYGNFHVRTTIMLALILAFSALILGLFVHDRVQKFMTLPEESFSVDRSRAELNFSLDFSRFGLVGPREAWHSMSDSELFWRASMVPRVVEFPYNRTKKVAFMFLARARLPLGPLWERFFEGHEGLFSIYVHSAPGYNYEPPESSVFYKRRIPSQEVEWGKKTMIDAEKRLLANALLDYSNERFVLLSDSCIPVFNFRTVFNHLIASEKSFLSAFDDPTRIGRGRYNKRMWPTVSLTQWRKGSQWFEAHRGLALDLVSDSRFYRLFVELCKPPCYMDEHYFPTLVNIIRPELTANSTITWVDWSRGGSHPATFRRKEISEEFLNRIRHGFNCTYNGHLSTICFLFARKFHANTLEPLLKIAPRLLGF